MAADRKYDYEAIRRHLIANPTCTAKQAAKVFDMPEVTLRAIAKTLGVRKEWVDQFNQILKKLNKEN